MRALLLCLAVALVAGAGAGPAAAATPGDGCAAQTCGTPDCYSATVQARPGMERRVTVTCFSARAVSLVSGPAHGSASLPAVVYPGVGVTVRMDADAPATDELVLRVQGPSRTVDLPVSVVVVPLSVNHAPTCSGDRITQRSDGSGPVDLFLHPSCEDPDGDPFTVYGGGPGTHPAAPKAIPSGGQENNWVYRTATADGHELGTVWGVDELGLRGEPGPLDVTVGPGIDRLPTCASTASSWSQDGVARIRTRPGRVRHLGLFCTDEDGDPVRASVVVPTTHGILAPVGVADLSGGWWTTEDGMDATYVPLLGDAASEDRFALQATGPRGTGPVAQLAMTTVGDEENSGGGCGWSPLQTTKDTPGAVTARCEDSEGDPLRVSVLSGPEHGTTGPGVVTEDRFGWQKASVPYVPDPGFTGADCIVMRLDDGHGAITDLKVEIDVSEQPQGLATVFPGPLVSWPPLPVQLPSALTATTPVGVSLRALLQAALQTRQGVTAVAPLPAGLEAWAPSRISRAALLRDGRAGALLLRCAERCRTTARTGLRGTGRRAALRSAISTSVAAEEPQLLWLVPDRRERALLKRTRAATAEVTVRVAVGGGKVRTLKRTLRITG